MKKQIRKIVVDDKEYAWNCAEFDDEGYPLKVIRIWQGKNNKIFSKETQLSSVTPKDIEKIIRSL